MISIGFLAVLNNELFVDSKKKEMLRLTHESNLCAFNQMQARALAIPPVPAWQPVPLPPPVQFAPIAPQFIQMPPLPPRRIQQDAAE